MFGEVSKGFLNYGYFFLDNEGGLILSPITESPVTSVSLPFSTTT